MQNQINQQNPNRQRRFPPICRFFATEAGCRSGVDCAFAHIIPASKEIPGVSSPHESEQTSVEGDTRGKQASSNPSRRVQSHNPERTDQAVIVGQRPYSAQGGHRGGRRNGNNKSPAPPNRQGQRSRLHYNQHKEGSSSGQCAGKPTYRRQI
ncbi:hypothetical protein BC936DRAFT_145236 [Jimgerdemannia flammicorona]|uniref:C3H1-type domain-containing protein n=1 Tax=Jimgerdemannia flammicorona TaxID=994334 RepID=A0A433DAH8_9FUNG|nr:hypothetical protein BC936DRAFT_145236 [Jimgerdemannia flammicorona]